MFKQIELRYDFKDLEPHIDEVTMVTHYSKHHAAYTANFNGAVEKLPELSGKSVEEIFVSLPKVSDESLKAALTNNGGGFYNHNLYFSTLSPQGGKEPEGELAAQIQKDFGDFNALKEKLSAAAATRFGSGWAWLSSNKKGELKVSSSPNQDNPIIESRGEWTPILGIDVWEHAYYLKYKNLRADYIKAFFDVVDWKEVAENYSKAKA
ncbi:superoxide dismutase [Mn] [Anaerocolumna cellulosilytica]|uniref:Superoxide dismutase n=1 Tax=Anaerocolumna cellulosilytica TaxID=433286 RepID=A0A6S6R3G4_9FIRM|nr:superoxide dismutase [Anaerocolumna cellulosilytica]MBB5197248.1 Fe-Mn family superoxide dismutase [Anaerocolumna cellulosilytica]BCJ94055.1 superoxide dismutase [Mn] [Anaerocolumna cellulosilytica]